MSDKTERIIDGMLEQLKEKLMRDARNRVSGKSDVWVIWHDGGIRGASYASPAVRNEGLLG